ncbi:MAG: sigma-54 dependent transcriptional regulator [Thermoanaerobaculia bacterium]
MSLVLLVDDDEDSLQALDELVRLDGLETSTARTLEAARAVLANLQPDAVLADYNLPDGQGIELAATCAERGIDFILVTGEGTLETAIEALRSGASDFLTKPVDAARLKILLAGIARTGSFRREISDLRSTLRELGRFGSMVGSSKAMQAVYDRISRVAPTDATVLVTGESGTGKELVAETVHRLSRRAHRPYIAINCGAIAANLIESELFGHERGAFTGADRQRKGVFERAHQGTLFLDEVSEMPLELQVKLLRVLESGEFTRVGGEKPMTADVRIVAASNRDLEARVAEGAFRADLLYRLRVVPIELPALRERDEDVRNLARHFLSEFSTSEKREKRFSPAAIAKIERHSFPGNVRELRNAVQQAFILAEDEIGVEHLPTSMNERNGKEHSQATGQRSRTDGASLSITVPVALAEVERDVILATLEKLGGDKPKAAELLGISLKTLYSRLREYSARTEA